MVFANKKIFKNSKGEIHIGNNFPEGFSETSLEEVKVALNSLNGKKLWRCHVCNDLRIAETPLKICPTCFQADAFIEINENEFRRFLEI